MFEVIPQMFTVHCATRNFHISNICLLLFRCTRCDWVICFVFYLFHQIKREISMWSSVKMWLYRFIYLAWYRGEWNKSMKWFRLRKWEFLVGNECKRILFVICRKTEIDVTRNDVEKFKYVGTKLVFHFI